MFFGVLVLWITFCFSIFPLDVWGQTKSTTIDFQLKANIIVLRVIVNGVTKNFALDTGASRMVITRETSNELGLKGVERTRGRGVGGEIEVSVVRVDSFIVDDIVLRDFSCVVADLTEINQAVGGGISGVLGFDFLSKFRITIDYREKRLTFEQYEPESLATFTIEGDRFISPKYRIELERPDPSWEFITETPLPQIPVILRKKGTTGAVTIQIQEIHGIQLEQVIPSIEVSLSLQIAGYKKLSSSKLRIADKDGYVVEYKGKEKGEAKHFKHVFFKVKENLYSIKCYASSSEFASLASEFDKIIHNIRVLE